MIEHLSYAYDGGQMTFKLTSDELAVIDYEDAEDGTPSTEGTQLFSMSYDEAVELFNFLRLNLGRTDEADAADADAGANPSTQDPHAEPK